MAAWCNLQDTGAADELNDRYGLLRADGSSKPPPMRCSTSRARGAGPNPSCGGRIDAAAPQLALSMPGAAFADELSLRVQGSATSPCGASSCCATAGASASSIRRGAPLGPSWATSTGSQLPPGQHALTARLFDDARHVTPRSVVFTRPVGHPRRGADLHHAARRAPGGDRRGLRRRFQASGRVTIPIAGKLDGRSRTFNRRHRNARRRTVVALPSARHALRVDGSL
jgi:hypothetical protein